MPQLNRLGIPADVLKGKIREFKSVHVIYKKVLYENFMAKLQKSFFDRAFYGTDDYNQKWPPLQRYTDEIKLGLIDDGESNPQVTGEFTNKRQLSPKQLAEYKNNYRTALNQGKKGGSIRQAGRMSLQNITLVDLGDRVNFEGTGKIIKTPINIRTSRLSAALSPGEVTNNRIYGGPDQDFRLNGLNVQFSLDKIPYAKEVEGPMKSGNKMVERPIITEAHIHALYTSHDIAIRQAKTEYDRILLQQQRNNDSR